MTQDSDGPGRQMPGIDLDAQTQALTPGQDKVRTTDGHLHDQEPAAAAAIGDYRIIRKIGEGGMGVVYEAEQQRPRRRVALKVVRGGLASDDRHIKMFEREIEALARLKHPGIASIYESGRSDDGQMFFAMEFVEGVDLADFIERRRTMTGALPSVDDQLRLFARIAEVVSYAHLRGIIHRDLKPQNILVTDDGDVLATLSGERVGVKILDFGLARINDPEFRGNTAASEVGQIKGTLLYMSPEQLKGRPDEIDVRSDVYALGVMLYEMLTGRIPYDLSQASLPEAMRIICEDPPIPFSRAMTETGMRTGRIDRDVETIVLKALEKEPARRYQGVAAMLDDVERYLTSQPILARPPSPYYQFRKLVARHRAAFASLAVIFVLLLAFGIAMAAQSVRIANERDRAQQAREDAEHQRSEAERSRNEALTARHEESKQRRVAEENLKRAEDEQERAEDALNRAEEQRSIAQRSQRAEADQRRIAEQNLEAARREALRAETQTTIANEQKLLADSRKMDAENKAEEYRRLAYAAEMNLGDQAWKQSNLADLDTILTAHIPTLGEADLRGFEWFYLWKRSHQDLVSLRQSGDIYSATFSLDGRYLIISRLGPGGRLGAQQRLSVVDMATANELRSFLGVSIAESITQPSQTGAGAGLTADGKAIVWKNERGMEFGQLDLTTGEFRPLGLRLPSPPVIHAISPDGKLIALRSSSSGGNFELWNLESGQRLLSESSSAGTVTSLAFSRDGKQLAVGYPPRGFRLLDLTTLKQTGFVNSRIPIAIAFAPDSKHIAGVDYDGIRLWETDSLKEVAHAAMNVDAPFTGRFNLQFSPHGDSVAVAVGTSLHLLDSRTLRTFSTMKVHGRSVTMMTFAPAGDRIATVSLDGTLKVWNVGPRPAPVFNPRGGAGVLMRNKWTNAGGDGEGLSNEKGGAAVTSDGRHIIVGTGIIVPGSSDQEGDKGRGLVVIDSETNREVASFGGDQGSSLESPKVSPDGRVIAAIRTPTGTLELWDSFTRTKIVSIEANCRNFAFSPDGQFISIAGLENRRSMIRVWSVPDNRFVFDGKPVAYWPGISMAFSRDSATLAVYGAGPGVQFVDLQSREETHQPIKLERTRGASVYAEMVAFSPDGTTLAILHEWNLKIFRYPSLDEVAILRGSTANLTGVAFSNDGKRVAAGGQDGTLRIWDLSTRKVVSSIRVDESPGPISLQFTPDGRNLVTTSSIGVQIWRGATDEEVARQRGK
jgi:serine/threonine protein kinase/WD40 repeat protein